MRKLPFITQSRICLDIGCGKNTAKGCVGIDIKDYGQEVIWDIRDGIPFADDSVDEIRTCHFLEHLDEDEGKAFLVEVLRVLKIGGEMRNRVPHVSDETAFYAMHKTFWNEARVDALVRSEIGEFRIIENEKRGKELFFTIKK